MARSYGGPMPLMSADELTAFLQAAFPDSPPPFVVTSVEHHRVELELPARATMLRPGGTISGPTLMTMADTAAYVVVLAEIGPIALAVTSSLTIQFLRKPPAAGLVASTEMLRLGRRQAVVDVRLRSMDDPRPVAQATVTYSIPVGTDSTPLAGAD